jgi:hypothetical protein
MNGVKTGRHITKGHVIGSWEVDVIKRISDDTIH